MKTLPDDLARIREYLPEMINYLEEFVPYASALVTDDSGFYLSLEQRNKQISELPPRRGVVFTIHNGITFYEWATDNLDPNFLKEKLHSFSDALKRAQQVDQKYSIDPGPKMDRHFTSDVAIDPASFTLNQLMDKCQEQQSKVKTLDSRINQVQVSLSNKKEHKIFVNRNKCLSSSLMLCTFVTMVIGSHKGKNQMTYVGAGGVKGLESLEMSDEKLRRAVDELGLLFHSKPLNPGRYEVIAAPEVSGIIAHEAFGHGVETDMFVKGRAKAVHYMDKQVASPLVTMIDDPTFFGEMGSYFFDDEGELGHPTVIIDKGFLRRGMTDLASATVLNMERSANGRRESFRRKAYARMSNTFFAEGKSNLDEMLAQIENGYYLKKSMSGMEDPKGWGIQVNIHLAQEIKNGKITSNSFAPLTITGFIPTLLSSISMVGNDLGFLGAGGYCGKGHKELVRVSSGGPHLRFSARLG